MTLFCNGRRARAEVPSTICVLMVVARTTDFKLFYKLIYSTLRLDVCSRPWTVSKLLFINCICICCALVYF